MALMSLVKVEKWIEIKTIWCFEVALWKQNKEEVIHWRFMSCPVCTSQPSSTLSLTLPFCIFQVVKRKEKKQIIFLYIRVVVVLPCIQHVKLHEIVRECEAPVCVDRDAHMCIVVKVEGDVWLWHGLLLYVLWWYHLVIINHTIAQTWQVLTFVSPWVKSENYSAGKGIIST